MTVNPYRLKFRWHADMSGQPLLLCGSCGLRGLKLLEQVAQLASAVIFSVESSSNSLSEPVESTCQSETSIDFHFEWMHV